MGASVIATQISADLPGITDPDLLYHYRLGVFHAMWNTVDVVTDWAIGYFLAPPHAEGHMVTWGMMYGAKAKLLASLVSRSNHPKKKEVMAALNALRGHAERDVIAHGYQITGGDHIGFLERPRSTDFTSRYHSFTSEEFRMHVDKLIGDGNRFYDALDVQREELEAFVAAASNLASKS